MQGLLPDKEDELHVDLSNPSIAIPVNVVIDDDVQAPLSRPESPRTDSVYSDKCFNTPSLISNTSKESNKESVEVFPTICIDTLRAHVSNFLIYRLITFILVKWITISIRSIYNIKDYRR